MVEAGVSAEDVVAAFGRLRSHWRGLFDSPRDSERRSEPDLFREIGEDLSTLAAAARISEEAVPFVESTFRARLGSFGVDEGSVPETLPQAARTLHIGFETLVRALAQMESGDDILAESGREMRGSAARTVAFFHGLRHLDGSETGTEGEKGEGTGSEGSGDESRPRESREDGIRRLVQSYDARRKHIREDTEVPPPAIEAVEFLLRLGAG